MRILRLDLLAFGPFTDRTLDFATPEPGLHIVYGDNEAGKSSCLRAVRQWLYGFPHQSSDDFLHPKSKLRLGGCLVNQQGESLEFIRRKGRKETLRSIDDQDVLPDESLIPFLQAIDAESFCKRFSLDHVELVRGGQSLGTSNELGEVLFAAGAGIADIRSVQADIESQCRDFFLPNGVNPRVNAALRRMSESRAKLRDLLLPSAQWVEVERALEEANDAGRQLDQEITETRRQLTAMERLHKAVPLMARKRMLEEEFASVSDVPVVSTEFAERRTQATIALSTSTEGWNLSQQKVKQLQKRIEEVELPLMLLNHRAVIVGLHTKLGSIQKATQDRQRLSADLRALERTAGQLLTELTDSFEIESAEEWQIGTRLRARLQELATEHRVSVERYTTATTQLRKIQQAIEAEDRLSKSCNGLVDIDGLKDAVRRHSKASAVEDELHENQRELALLDQRWEDVAISLPLYKGKLEDLLRIPVPLESTVDQFATEHDRLSEQRATLQRRYDDLAERHKRLQQKLDALQMTHDVPSESNLIAVRAQRGVGWQLLCRVVAGELSATSAEVTKFLEENSGGPVLTDAIGNLIQEADLVADRLRREADRVAQKAQWTAECREIERQQSELKDMLVSADADREAWQGRWMQVWESTNVVPLSPDEMRDWLRKREDIVELANLRRQCSLRIDGNNATLDTAGSGLREVLAQLEWSGNRQPNSVSELVEECDKAIRRHEKQAQVEAQRRQRLSDLQLTLAECQQRLGEAEEAHLNWHEQWQIALLEARLSGTLTAAELPAVVQSHDKLLSLTNEIRQLQQRIAGIDRDYASFHSETTALLSHEGLELHLPAEQAVSELYERLEVALRNETKLEQWREQLATAEMEGGRHDAERARWRHELEKLCELLGCPSMDLLPQAEAKGLLRRDLEQQLGELQRQLQDLSFPLPLSEFMEQITVASTEDLEWKIQQTLVKLQDLERQRTEKSETIGQLKNQIASMDGSSAAAQFQEEIEQHLATIRSETQQYIRLRLSGSILRRVIDRYRQSNQGPVLERASELFRQLTLDSFSGLRIETNDDGSFFLVGVRPDRVTTVQPNGMSEGTCDQMYLAIRLALLEAFLKTNPAVPLLVDDLLITFDDSRAVAALRILAELSQRTQVIFFTHHQRLVELASDHLLPNSFSLQDLASGEPMLWNKWTEPTETT